MQKGRGDKPSKARPIVVDNTYRGPVLGFRRLYFPRSFVVSNSFEVLIFLPDDLLSIPLIGFRLDTLLIVVYPTFDCTRLVTVRVLAT